MRLWIYLQREKKESSVGLYFKQTKEKEEKMKKLSIQRIEAKGTKTSEISIWMVCLSFLFVGGGTDTLIKACGIEYLSYARIFLVEIVGILCCVFAITLKKKIKYAGGLYAVPWVLFLLITSGSNYWSGAKAWVNAVIGKWNLLHEGGIALFSGSASVNDVQGFLCLFILVFTQVSVFLVSRNNLIGEVLYSLFCLVIALVSGEFRTLTMGLLVVGLLGSWMSTGKTGVAKKTILWTIMLAAVLCICSALIPDQKMVSITEFQDSVKETIHDIRYGKKQLPEGDLRDTHALKQSSDEMLQVQTEQEKTLYLRGYVGGKYQDGVWSELPDSFYGEENAGLMKWLEEQSFDPQAQVAAYYSLSEAEDKPEENKVTVIDKKASRDHMYVPITFEKFTLGRVWEEKDQSMIGKGFFGVRKSTFKELSGSRPSELMVTQNWVTNPKTKAQKNYSKAEAVYRKFVYQSYTTIDRSMNDLMQEVFWSDYESDSDGIYSAVNQIRKVLKTTTTYSETVEEAPDDEDPVRYFLTKSWKGNSMLYASTAVEALRAHGIPARYVEGYYVSADMIAQSRTVVSVTGQDTHAWAEVYFDGIGWLPIDVTPGYYYDAVTLQQMVNTPDVVHKNAALDPNSYQSASVTDSEGRQKSTAEKIKNAAKITATVLLGFIGIVLIIILVLFIVLEIRHLYFLIKLRRIYAKKDGAVHVRLAEKLIFQILGFMGIEASLGWEAEQVEQELTGKSDKIKKGDYVKTCMLLEKSIYGEIDLEAYEERTVETFIRKLYEAAKSGDWKARLRLRYTLKI